MSTYAVTGAGPVGWSIAEQLAARGDTVRILTRSGSGPDHPLIERRRVDASDASALEAAVTGAAAVFHCIHASAYSEAAWKRELPAAEAVVLEAAGRQGAVVVFPESLYSYSRPDTVMTEDSERAADSGKRGVRTALLATRAASATDTVSVVASDFFGPRVRTAHAGERMVPAILQGKPIQLIGSADMPHSFTYTPDLAAAMIAAADLPRTRDRILHAPTLPALTQRELVAAFAAAAGVRAPKLRGTPGWTLRALGAVLPSMRELAEMTYQFDLPFVMDSTASTQVLGLEPTALDAAIADTLLWWRSELGAAVPSGSA
ncbi:NAD-dependent epimerase/dehydratase family protein [Arthrobacter sp. NamB2]|uniref:NAD-dependent epimerase/dehydratase family protein n=1 Tax=Arthrobacter sp. NamB2 TaxID=2576035 RepID=UPI0010C97FC4|nr:NAD-dependent epimerase/dehydratase family protein [Arthrobacter sp. NamB2]TKV28458.1 NAD-dependent epimerase/dehydratase family protein [Arthrobacter sp. NamB2]